MDPAIISAGIGLLSSVFGKKQQVPNHVLEQYKLLQDLVRRGIDLYDNTDLERLDAEAVQRLGSGVQERAMGLLANYDAKAAARGSGANKSDTKKDRAKVQIAADAALPIAQFEAGLLSSRPGRKAALLPSPSGAAAGFGAAQYLDERSISDYEAQIQGLMGAAQLAGKLFGKKGAAQGPAVNDRYGQIYRPGGWLRGGG